MKTKNKKAVLIIIGSINPEIKIVITKGVKANIIFLGATPTFLPHEVHFVDMAGPKKNFLTKEIPS
jgi:hypothetical protein